MKTYLFLNELSLAQEDFGMKLFVAQNFKTFGVLAKGPLLESSPKFGTRTFA